mgnify:FL=1
MNKAIEKIFEKTKQVKLRIDRSTVITIKSKNALKAWLKKFPQAQVVSS